MLRAHAPPARAAELQPGWIIIIIVIIIIVLIIVIVMQFVISGNVHMTNMNLNRLSSHYLSSFLECPFLNGRKP